MKSALQWPQVLAFRLARHHLSGEKRAALEDVCRAIGGFQAQVNSAAQLAAWARLPGMTQTEIQPALQTALFEQRTLVKTSCMRQTLHIIPAPELALYLSALKESRVRALWRIAAKFGVTRQHTDELNAIVMDALSGGPLPRAPLLESIKQAAGNELRAWMNVVWGIQIFRLALVEGLICYGPEQGAESTFVRVDQWLPEQPVLAPAAALAELLRRYLRAYGPATPQDFARWTGNSMA